jgi:hypothetical protein
MYYSSLPIYEMLGKKDPPNTYGDLSSGQGMEKPIYLIVTDIHVCLLTTDIYKNKHCVKYDLILRSNCFFNIEDSCLTLTIIQASISCRYHKHQVILKINSKLI